MTAISTTEMARALAALRRIVTVPCRLCGTPMTGHRHRRYCSDRCRQRACRLRRQARASPTPRPAGALDTHLDPT